MRAGATQPITVRHACERVESVECGGGNEDCYYVRHCPTCGGVGDEIVLGAFTRAWPYGQREERVPCETCDGSGEVSCMEDGTSVCAPLWEKAWPEATR